MWAREGREKVKDWLVRVITESGEVVAVGVFKGLNEDAAREWAKVLYIPLEYRVVRYVDRDGKQGETKALLFVEVTQIEVLGENGPTS